MNDQGRVRRRAVFDDNLEDEIGDDDDEEDDDDNEENPTDDEDEFGEIKLRSVDNKVLIISEFKKLSNITN